MTAGIGSAIYAGNGNDNITAGYGCIITVGNGNDTVFGGPNDTITLGHGNDTVAFGVSPNETPLGGETINGFGNHDVLRLVNLPLFVSYAAMISAGDIVQSGANTVISDVAQGGSDTITLTGITPSHLTSSNFKFA